ncbi:glycosyltransferase [Moheibacter sediminis]|uniref:Glycosyltransferase, GT2 family n=1 Tax=Moheibacter sediminis TaxID=1434700 RepID=A0A1W2AMF5_9FLAO|nr:glycosyltransferase family 2 protein [Moheibacter sediminis]SMC61408.1 Glycosyltransferase, GT2 family [Moheibacter sediminis]
MNLYSTKTAIIIVTYNAKKWVDICLPPLYDIENFTIIVIDNASRDETCSIIKKKYPNVHLIESKENLGFGKANNLGMRIAIDEDFDYVFLQNQDAAIDEKNLKKLIKAAQSNSEFGIISPVHFKNDNEIENLFTGYIKNTPFKHFDAQSERLINADFINAALWLLPIKTIREIGGFNPLFSHYGEDVDYVKRVNYFDYKLGFVEGAKAFHYRDYDMEKIRKESSQKRHFGPWHTKYYSLLTDVNKSSFSVFWHVSYLFLTSLAKHIVQFNFNSVKWDLKIFSDVILKMPYIYKINRKQITQKGELFL